MGGTFLVQLFTGNQVAMFLVPSAIGALLILPFAATLKDRRLAQADKPTWSVREFLSAFYVNPRKSPDFAWAFASRFMLLLAYAFLTTYQAYYLLEKIGSAETEVPRQVFLATVVQSAALVVAALVSGRLSDWSGRRKVFVLIASIVYGVAMFAIAIAGEVNGFLVGMAISGLGFGMYMAVDLALVADVLPDPAHAAKDLGVFNMAGHSRSPSPRRSHRPSWRWPAAATACSTRSPASAPSSEPCSSCPEREAGQMGPARMASGVRVPVAGRVVTQPSVTGEGLKPLKTR